MQIFYLKYLAGKYFCITFANVNKEQIIFNTLRL